MKKKVFVIDNFLCTGCRNCEMWCSIAKGNRDEFKPSLATITVSRDPEGKVNIPTVDCDASGCALREGDGLPICVEMCPTGAIIFCDLKELKSRRAEYLELKKEQPLFRLIAPWKYPYPYRRWSSKEI